MWRIDMQAPTILKPHTTKAPRRGLLKLNGATSKADFLKMIYEEATEVGFSYLLPAEPLTNRLSSPETGKVWIYMTPLETSPLFTGTIPLWGRTIEYLVPTSTMSEKSPGLIMLKLSMLFGHR
jgi:hypothetical protein